VRAGPVVTEGDPDPARPARVDSQHPPAAHLTMIAHRPRPSHAGSDPAAAVILPVLATLAVWQAWPGAVRMEKV
jgi:hypothetical protein